MGALLFSGAQDQTLTPGLASTVSLTNLTLRNVGAAGANQLFLAGDLTVGSLLPLTKGLVRTQGPGSGAPLYTLSLPAGGRCRASSPASTCRAACKWPAPL